MTKHHKLNRAKMELSLWGAVKASAECVFSEYQLLHGTLQKNAMLVADAAVEATRKMKLSERGDGKH